MRFFAQIAYRGSDFNGWQIQPNAPSVQQAITDGMETIFREPIPIVGCGRTDTGVHASDYYFHFEADSLPPNFKKRLNFIVGDAVAIQNIWEMKPEAHARFSALSRSYTYEITAIKNPLTSIFQWYHFKGDSWDIEAMNKAASIIKSHKSFFPFCKTKSDNLNFDCDISHCEWMRNGDILQFNITANRFLRGMIRLMVGALISIGEGNLSLEVLEQSLVEQTRLPKPYSVPPTGLRLSKIKYPPELFVRAVD